jgi:CubicO group peptidase (beta-lactamase class C family)
MSVNSQIDAIFKPWKSTDAPGMAVAVSKNGRIVHTDAYGMADLDHRIPNRPNTVFHCASVAKQFTAMSILLLAAQRKNGRPLIDLDDDVGNHIEEMRHLPKITIRQLLHHTSGIRDMLIQLTLAGWRWGDDAITRADVLDLVSRMQTLNFRPGERFAYSNTNYFLAGEIVRRKSGMLLSEFAQQKIFKPLGMTRTRFVETYGEPVKDRAYGYRQIDPTKRVFERRMPNYNLSGPTNLFTTVEDLLRWDGNFDSHEVGGPRAVAAMQKPAPNSNGYGLGLFVVEDQDDEPRTISHDGRTIGYNAHVSRYNHDGISVALLCNIQFGDTLATDRLVFAVARVAEGKPLPPLNILERERFPIQPLTPQPARLDEYCGTYHNSEIEATFEIEMDGGALVLNRPRYAPCELTWFDQDTFLVRKFTDVLREVEFTFLRNGKDLITEFRLDWSRNIPGPRLMDFRFVKRK